MNKIIRFASLMGIFLALMASTASAETLSVMSWNLEGRDKRAVVAAEISPEMATCHLLCLTRANSPDAVAIQKTLGRDYLTCKMQRPTMRIFYDQNRLECLRQDELKIDQVHSWLGLFRDRVADVEFYVLVNEFKRGEVHRAQAESVRIWCERQMLPIIGLGDFGFEVNYESLRGNRPFDEFMRDYRWRWVRPHPLDDTFWSDADQDGQDDHPNSCSDFIYLGGGGLNWLARVKVDSPQKSDKHSTPKPGHRPVRLSVDPR